MSDSERTRISPVLAVGDRLTLVPIVHGSGDCALEVRRLLLEHSFDCLAVPLPPSFQADVEQAIDFLPVPTLVTQREKQLPGEGPGSFSYVPIDPCQPVIMGLRVALQERRTRVFIDLETAHFDAYSTTLPDCYALKKTSLDRFTAALLPAIPPPAEQPAARIAHMARRLRELTRSYRSVVCLCSILDWPWLRAAYQHLPTEIVEPDEVAATSIHGITRETLAFIFGELPFITGLYERARAEWEDDENLSIDGVKQLLQETRERYQQDAGRRRPVVPPSRLAQCLQYIRNLTLLDHRLTPDMYTLVVAAQQVINDTFALHLAETVREYPYYQALDLPTLRFGLDKAMLPDGEVMLPVSRLPGPPRQWRTVRLHKKPEKWQHDKWVAKWNPFSQCSWPPEDTRVENFRASVMDRAKAILGGELARTEKFTTSVKDGIDIRDTLRHWHDGQIYVKVIPPSRDRLDCVLMLFDSPADPRDYAWRSTWYAEHQEESTLAFFATDFRREMIGPGICQANYGGAMFLYPPRVIPDVWSDPRFDFTDTLEERLLAASCFHSEQRHVAVLSTLPPGAGFRRLARKYHKQLVHVPLSKYSESTIANLRCVHVLNGHEVRSYAAQFIREP
ncbi:MAG: hypothetical protein ACKOBW_15465 [Planctomycetota bacterium]